MPMPLRQRIFEKLKETGRCIKCDLFGAKLSVSQLARSQFERS